MEPIRVILQGALGKVGKEIVNAVCKDIETQLTGAADLLATKSTLTLPDESGEVPLSTDINAILAKCEADVLVGIIAWRYGWEPDGKKSITEMEYDAAKERLMFQLDPSLSVNPEEDFDQDEDKWDKQKKMEKFKRRFSKDQMPAYFNQTTLQAKVLYSLQEWRKRREQTAGDDEAVDETGRRLIEDPGLGPEISDYRIRAESLYGFLPVAGFATQSVGSTPAPFPAAGPRPRQRRQEQRQGLTDGTCGRGGGLSPADWSGRPVPPTNLQCTLAFRPPHGHEKRHFAP